MDNLELAFEELISHDQLWLNDQDLEIKRLREVQHLPLVKASKKLGYSETKFKQMLRSKGIKWPYRYLCCLEKIRKHRNLLTDCCELEKLLNYDFLSNHGKFDSDTIGVYTRYHKRIAKCFYTNTKKKSSI
jgi:hypothetical protein